MPSQGHNCSRKTFPLLFPGTALGSFLSGVVTKGRGCGHSGSDGGTPFASALRPPSGTSFILHLPDGRATAAHPGNAVQAAGPASRSHSGAQGSALLPWRSVYPAKGLVYLQYHRGSSIKTETMDPSEMPWWVM